MDMGDRIVRRKEAPVRGNNHLVSPWPRPDSRFSHLQQRRRVLLYLTRKDFISGRELGFIEVPFIHSNHPGVSRLLKYGYNASYEKTSVLNSNE